MASNECIAVCIGIILDQVPAPASWAPDPAAAMRRTVDLWALGFGEVPDLELQAAVASWLFAGARFWPAPSQIVAFLPLAVEMLDADSAWGHMLRLVGEKGHYQRPALGANPNGWRLHDDERQRAALEYGLAAIGGWQALCVSATDDRAIAASFRRSYEAGLARSPAIDLSAAIEARREQKRLGVARG